MRRGKVVSQSVSAFLMFNSMNVRDDDYAIGYRDAKAGNLPNSRQTFYDEEYILGYAHASMERDSLWQALRAHWLRLDQ